MAKGDPITSPWEWSCVDNFGRFISISADFNNSTRALQGATVTRDPECQWNNIYIGLGADGTPNTTIRILPVPEGTTAVGKGKLNGVGLNVIEDILALQITAGP